MPQVQIVAYPFEHFTLPMATRFPAEINLLEVIL